MRAAHDIQFVGDGQARSAAKRTQVAISDQITDRDLDADLLQEVLGTAYRPGGHPVGRRGQSDDAAITRERSGLRDEPPVHALAIRRNQVGLVDDHQVDRAQFASAVVDRVDACDRDRLMEFSPAEAGREDTDFEVRRARRELLDGLAQKLLHVGEHHDASLPLSDRIGA